MKQFLKKLLPAPTKQALSPSAQPLSLRELLTEEQDMHLNTTPRDRQLIVSLTASPETIEQVHMTIRSVLLQSIKPDMVILWLAYEQFPKGESSLPFSLRGLCKFGLTIKWCESIGGYAKLLPALREYPEAVIVTAEPVGIYDRSWLEALYMAYTDSVAERKPRICCHNAVKLDKPQSGESLTISDRSLHHRPTYLHIPMGIGGVLYPPHSLHPDAANFKKAAAMQLSSEDLWFWVMSAQQKLRTKVCVPSIPAPAPFPGAKKSNKSKPHSTQLLQKDLDTLTAHFPQLQEALDWEWELLHPQWHTMEHNAALSPEEYEKGLEMFYAAAMDQDIDIHHPVNHNEKIQWLKLYGATPEKTLLADKYLVRNWIAEKIGTEYLIPLIGVYDNAEEIDFDSLPQAFVLKTNHGSGWNLVVNNKDELNWAEVKETSNHWLTLNYAYKSFEMHYRDIPPKLMIEQFLFDKETGVGASDYKVFCFHGKPTYVWVDSDRSTDHHRDIFDTDWNLMPFNVAKTNAPITPAKPEKLEEMLKLSEILSQGFPMVRVDFYYVNNTIYFGEMTLTPGNGISKFIPTSTSYLWGDQFKLPFEDSES